MRTTTYGRVAIGVVLAIATYAAAGFLFVPWLLQRYVPPLLERRLGLAVSVGEFRANPFLPMVEALDVTVGGERGEPLLSARRLAATASLPGLLRGAVALDEVRLEGLRVRLVLGPDGALDAAAAARRWAGTADAAGPARPFVLDRLAAPGARLVVVDRSGAAPAQASIGPIDLEAANLSTLGGDGGTYRLDARLPAGGTLLSQGELALHPSLQSSGSVRLQGLQAGVLLPFVRAHAAVSALEGTLSASARFVSTASGSLQVSGVSMDAAGVRVDRPGATESMLQAGRIRVAGAAADFAQAAIRLGELDMADGSLRAERDRDGVLDWAALPRSADARSAPPARAPRARRGWTLEATTLRLRKIDLGYTDRSSQPGTSLRVDDLSASANVAFAAGARAQLRVTDLQAGTGALALDAPTATVRAGALALRQGHFDLAARTAGGAVLRFERGDATLSPSAAAPAVDRAPAATDAGPAGAAWRVTLDSLQLAAVGGRLAAESGKGGPPLAVRSIDGSLRLAVQLGGAKPQVIAQAIDARVRDLTLAMSGDAQPLRVAEGRLAGGRVDLAARRFGATQLDLSGAATLVRGAQGRIELPVLFAPGDPSPASPSPASRGAAAPAWRYAIERLRLPRLRIALVDRTVAPALRLRGTLQAEARGVASGKQASFDAKLALAGGGSLSAAGTASDDGTVRAGLRAEGVALRPLQPLLARYAALRLRSGALSGSLDVTATRDGGLRAAGSLGIADLDLADAASGERLLACRQFDVQGLALDLARRDLSASEVALTGPQAKVVVSEDRKLNIAQVFARAGGAAGRAGGGDPAFHVAIGRVVLRDGEVDFADRSLVLPFSTTVKQVHGTIVDISSDPSHRASVRAEGSIAPYGSASVEGSLVPFDPMADTDLQARFSNVQVPPLSPYTATFAGRKVRSGKLWLSLDYRVADGELLGSNDVSLSDFTLGERVDAPNALDVPLDLVVALLSDGDGEIRLSVPVTGELGDARFSVASAVRQALGNVLRRVVSAPFRALANLFGGGSGEALAAIGFEPGSAALRPEQVEKLDALARALRDRPRLQLLVSAPYDPQEDVAALREEQARESLAQALGQPRGPDGEPLPVAYDDPATRRELERLVRANAGAAAVGEVRGRYAGQGERAVARGLFERLAASQPLADSAVRLLAVERARGITRYLERHGVDGSRVRAGRLEAERAGTGGEVTARLGLAAGSARP